MRVISNIVIHCTATDQKAKVSAIQKYWRDKLGWTNPGYHYIVDSDGNVENLLDVDEIANGVRGHNHDSIHIAYIGGVDNDGRPMDNKTKHQEVAILKLLLALVRDYPFAEIKGHRDFSGVKKACPSFDVAEWLKIK